MNITTCWNMTPCPLINMYQCSEGTCFFINIHQPLYNSGSVYLTIGPQPLPNQVFYRVQYSATSFSFQHLLTSLSLYTSCLQQGQIKLFGAPRQWKNFCPLFQAVFLLGGCITPQTESNTTPPSPKTEITNILFSILNFASIIKFLNVTFL